ncbi:MAG: NAD(+) diphosphatase [Desulfofustis sp.]|nr:NAD(+) diphosphatase [Desulfofustis sp.]
MPYFGPVPADHGPAYWFVFSNSQLLLARNAAGQPVLPYGENLPIPEACVSYARLIGTCRQSDCIVVDCAGDGACEHYGLEPIGLRQAADLLGNELWLIAGRADQILTWHRSHVFCGSCGTRLTEKSGEAVKVCSACAATAYPRLAPAVIMAVIRDDAILLGRAPRFPAGMYSTLAGFVEPGETLEGAVAREVGEEVGIEVTGITYVASQPWPFPYSLMVGFTCRYLRGEIRVNRDELEDAAWFTVDRLPRLPPRISIARFLIEQFLAEQRKAGI